MKVWKTRVTKWSSVRIWQVCCYDDKEGFQYDSSHREQKQAQKRAKELNNLEAFLERIGA